MPRPHLLRLSAELILRTLSFLDLADLHSCQLSHRSLHAIIKDSVLLRYLRALKAAGMEDNRLCSVGSLSERLRILGLQEDAWAGHLVESSQEVEVPEDLSSYRPYSLEGGMCFFEDFDENFLPHYVSLPPSPASDKIHWKEIENVSNEVITAGLAVFEHDLIVIVGTSEEEDVQTVEISLYEASSGNPHPLARKSKISVPLLHYGKVKIMGKHLVLVTTENVEVYEWQTGILKMKISTTERTYNDCLFLSPQLLLLPNVQNNTLEFWDIPERPDMEPRTFPNGALALPPIKHDSTVTSISCHGESFSGSYARPNSSLPFHPSVTNAIAIFKIHIEPVQGPSLQFTMFVHHQSLLEFYPMPPSLLTAPEKSSITSANVIPWDKWGPPATRLSTSDGLWSCLPGSNQRCAFIDENTDIIIWDFNPTRIQRLDAVTPPGCIGDEEEDVPPPSVITKGSHLNHCCLQESVTSSLPYALHTFRPEGIEDMEFQLVAIDDERLVGFQVFLINSLSTYRADIHYEKYGASDDVYIENFQVFHLGQATALEK